MGKIVRYGKITGGEQGIFAVFGCVAAFEKGMKLPDVEWEAEEPQEGASDPCGACRRISKAM